MQKEKPSINLMSESDNVSVSSFQSRSIKTLRGAKIPPAPAIDLSNNRLTSLKGLESPEIIKLLQLAHNEITTIEEDPFKRCSVLSYLDLSYNKIDKIQNLFFIPHLHSLNLSNNKIKRLENLEGCVSLRQLNVSDNSIRSIYLRSPLPKLVSLDLSGNNIDKLNGIAYFTGLSTLILDRCKLTNPTEIRSLYNLRTISLANNRISDFPPFYMALLSYVDLSHNSIKSLSPFTNFQSLVTLDISDNPIDDSGLLCDGAFSQMKEFRANRTNISKLSPLSSIAPNLVAVSVTFSKLNNMNDISNFVSNEKSLKYLDIRGNPINIECYPDITPNISEEDLKEYESEDIYNRAFQNQLDLRSDYRRTVLAAAAGQIAWLDGIKIPGKQSEDVVPPSKMNFLDQDDIEEIPSGCETPIRPKLQSETASVQCNLSEDEYNDSGYPEEEDNYSSEPVPRPPLNQVRRNLPHFEGDHPVYEQSENNGFQFDSASLLDSEDSGPYEIDHQKMGLEKTHNGVYGPMVEAVSDDGWEDDMRYSAATDAESDFGYTKFQPKPKNGKKPVMRNPVFDSNQSDIKVGKQGCSFWVPMSQPDPRSIPPRVKYGEPPKSKEQRYPPFRKAVPRKAVDNGHYPFNQRSDRRLPWEQKTTPSYASSKTKTGKTSKVQKKAK